MSLNFFNDVLRLNLAFEAAESIFQRLAFLEPHFSHSIYTPPAKKIFSILQLQERSGFHFGCQAELII